MSWLTKSNRNKHLLGGFLLGLLGLGWYAALLIAIAAGACLELKDKLNGKKWDWIDLGCTAAGGGLAALVYVFIALVADPAFTAFIFIAIALILGAIYWTPVYRWIRWKRSKVGDMYKSGWKDDDSCAVITGKPNKNITYYIQYEDGTKSISLTTDYSSFFGSWGSRI